MEKKPLVSVIMNCHNSEKFVEEAILSVYKQTYLNWEIILWDNASDDDTANIVCSFNHKLRYFRSETKDTLSNARIKAVKKSKGEYLTFLDSDDIWYPNKLYKQIICFKNNKNVSLVYTRADILNKNKKKIGFFPNNEILPQGNVFEALAEENFIPFVSVMITKKIYNRCNGFAPNLVNATDYDLFIRISLNNYIIGLDEITCVYREHDTNLSRTTRVIGAKESLAIVNRYKSKLKTEKPLFSKKASLAIAYLKQLDFTNFFLLIIRDWYIGWVIIKRVALKFI